MILSVSELNEYVRTILSRDIVLRDVRVQGEVSGFKAHSSGHLYFSLKDENALIRCVMFRQSAASLTFRPTDGMRVTLVGYASLYTRDGQFQLYANSLERHGEGELYRRYLQLKADLERQGYFNEERKRPIPFLPKCVGVITSKTGAVLHDVTQIIRRRFPSMNIVVCSVPVQGAGASRLIANGIRRMNAINEASVLIVCRGGGSIEDLWAFNEPEVAEAILTSAIPVVSAVGHETDFTIADFVADLRAPTPSAAAELCVPEYDTLVLRLDELMRRLAQAPINGITAKRERLRLMIKPFASVRHNLSLKSQILTERRRELLSYARAELKKNSAELDKYCIRLEARSPANILNSGYVLVSDAAGNLITSAATLNMGWEYTLSMSDGQASAQITEIRTKGLAATDGE